MGCASLFLSKKKRGDTEGAEISNPPESAKKPLMMTANQQKQQQSAGPRPRHLRRCELSVGGKKEPSSPRPPTAGSRNGAGGQLGSRVTRHGSESSGRKARPRRVWPKRFQLRFRTRRHDEMWTRCTRMRATPCRCAELGRLPPAEPTARPVRSAVEEGQLFDAALSRLGKSCIRQHCPPPAQG